MIYQVWSLNFEKKKKSLESLWKVCEFLEKKFVGTRYVVSHVIGVMFSSAIDFLSLVIVSLLITIEYNGTCVESTTLMRAILFQDFFFF